MDLVTLVLSAIAAISPGGSGPWHHDDDADPQSMSAPKKSGSKSIGASEGIILLEFPHRGVYLVSGGKHNPGPV